MSRAPSFGIHIGLADTTPDAVIDLARRAEEYGFDWVSSWDHFYSVSPARQGNLEGVAMQAAIAAATSRVRVGVLCYNIVAYRHPAIIANAIATIDHISHGRAEVGLGAGNSQIEHESYGMTLLPPKERLDRFEEAAECVQLLLRQEVSNFDGDYFSLRKARCDPRPVQEELPIWIGGRGEKRMLRIVAKYATGWNAAWLTAAEFGRKGAILRERCTEIGRDPSTMAMSANVGIAMTPELLEHHHATLGDRDKVMIGAFTGSGDELVEQIGAYLAAGADQVNFTFRAPFHLEALDLIAPAVAQLRQR